MHQHTDSSDFIGNFSIPYSWNDGPLLKSMKNGDFLLIDEINLAEDSVLERINSVFEKESEIFVTETEKKIKAAEGFIIFASMNPGNDFGKKELSPALRNRFTEIYFEVEKGEIFTIFEFQLNNKIKDKEFCCEFSSYFKKQFNSEKFSVRKINEIVDYVDIFYNQRLNDVFVFDTDKNAKKIYELLNSFEFEINKINDNLGNNTGWDNISLKTLNAKNFDNEKVFKGVDPFYLSIKTVPENLHVLSNNAKINMKKILKAMILNKGILLRGSPGTGKTSIIQKLGELLGKKAIRINLSEETELSDLCGNWLPIPNNTNQSLEIKFIDSNMVNALKESQWVILDEINLASQSVLEGLNSALDYRREIFSFNNTKLGENARIFATMNKEGNTDGRKSLPKSFLDRFIVIDMEDYTEEDIKYIIKNLNFDKNLLLDNNIEIYEKQTNDYLNMFEACKNYFKSGFTLRKAITFSELKLTDEKIFYKYENNVFTIGSVNQKFFISCILDNSYALVHNDIKNIYILLKCIINKVPVIIKGSIGKSKMVEFVAKILSKNIFVFDCHEEIDVNDIIGQYQMNNKMIEWRNSILIENFKEEFANENKIIIFDQPEKIQKAVFDRLNSLFESKKTLNLHEKGYESEIRIEKSINFVLLCENLFGLSNAVIDRCWVIELTEEYNQIDIDKIISINKNYNSNKDLTSLCENLDNDHNLIYEKRNIIDENKIISHLKSLSTRNFMQDNEIILENFKRPKHNETETNFYELNIKNKLFKNKFDVKKFEYSDLCENTYFFHNELNENKIFEMINYKLQYFQLNDLEMFISQKSNFNFLLEFYKKINFNIQEKNTDQEKIKSLSQFENKESKIINFMKNRNLSGFKKLPVNIFNLKFEYLRLIKEKKIADFFEVKENLKNLEDLKEIEKVKFDDFYFLFLDEIFGINENNFVFDPILLLKIEFINNNQIKFQILLKNLKKEFANMYKYGESNIEQIFYEFNNFIKFVDENINLFKKLLDRNFDKYIQQYRENKNSSVSILDNIRNYNVFNDIVDYKLIKDFNEIEYYDVFEANSLYHLYNVIINADITVAFKIIEILKKYNIDLNPVFCKFLYNIFERHFNLNSKILINEADLLLEMISIENVFFEIDFEDSFYLKNQIKDANEFINLAIKSFIKDGCEYKVDFLKKNQITIEPLLNDLIEYNDIEKIKGLDILSDLKNIVDIYFIEFYKKTKKILEFDYNFSWFIVLFLTDLDKEKILDYILNCKIYQHIERIFFIESFLKINESLINSNYFILDNKNYVLLYNLSLQYRGFEILEKFERIKTNTYKKSWYCNKEIKNYIEFLEDETLNHIKEIKLDKKIYQCDCHLQKIKDKQNQIVIDLLLDTENLNEKIFDSCDLTNNEKTDNFLVNCFWKKIDKNKLKLLKGKNHKFYDYFMQREVFEKYSKKEILLSKIINEYINVLDHFTKENLSIIENLFNVFFNEEMGFCFLIYIYNSIQEFKEFDNDNTGEGMKEGTGEKNISEEIKNSNEIQETNDFNENENLSESDGVDMSNEGNMHDNELSLEELEDENTDGCLDETKENDVNESENFDDGNENEENEEEIIENKDSCIEDSENSQTNENSQINENNSDDSSNEEKDFNSDECNSKISEEIEESMENQNNFGDYKKTENKLNDEQTCEIAENYFEFVSGNNKENKALEKGDGDEKIDKGKKIGEEGIKNMEMQKIFNNNELYKKENFDSFLLANHLKNILEGNKRNKYKGNYKNGKKLNMKKIVPFILSDYKKDKIWLKRNKEEKREYLIRFFIDASKSMNEENLIGMMFSVFKKISAALDILNIQYEIYKFGSCIKKFIDIKDFLDNIRFIENETCLNFIEDFRDGINFILTDGIFQSQNEINDNFLFILIDKKGIKELKKIVVSEEGIETKKYLDSVKNKFCTVDEINDLETEFVRALSEMVKEIFK
ncbi:AAA ATPase midasin [Gurleya vavrai]